MKTELPDNMSMVEEDFHICLLQNNMKSLEDNVTWVSYGIQINDRYSKAIFCQNDISLAKEEVETLIKRLAETQISHIHFQDILDDYMQEIG